ncbi:PIN domain-containing protein [Capsulimonas corticalis]|uniref:PIN domain-containing protein n=1 Tax=Capsulimonas corticalis TaxID=2219043 RepID=A0A402CVA9_9BACT|nr:PIN domain-containing protein [Capsulimonas corticalis]BDI30342.1 PIN domain-containing protein [Capsulimonas corticalis]
MIVAVLDACVLYPPSLRDLLMWLAAVRIYAPRWTEEIHAEWIRNVLANKSELSPSQLERTRILMNKVSPNCVVSGYETHISGLNLPDIDDRHILAAAIEAKAPLIVTYNLSDFPNAILQTYGVQAAHPDDFLSALFDEQPALFLHGLQIHRASLRNPPKNVADYIQTLKATSLKGLAIRVEAHSDAI